MYQWTITHFQQELDHCKHFLQVWICLAYQVKYEQHNSRLLFHYFQFYFKLFNEQRIQKCRLKKKRRGRLLFSFMNCDFLSFKCCHYAGWCISMALHSAGCDGFSWSAKIFPTKLSQAGCEGDINKGCRWNLWPSSQSSLSPYIAIHSNQDYKAAARTEDGDKWAHSERWFHVAAHAHTHRARGSEQVRARWLGYKHYSSCVQGNSGVETRLTGWLILPTAEGRGRREGWGLEERHTD